MSVSAVAAQIAVRLRALTPLPDSDIDYEREELADAFEDIGSDPTASLAWFNDAMRDLWDWGDQVLPGGRAVPFSQTPKVCWVRTAF
jgi:hypothetical protein